MFGDHQFRVGGDFIQWITPIGTVRSYEIPPWGGRFIAAINRGGRRRVKAKEVTAILTEEGLC